MVAAIGKITINTAASETGVISLYIGGIRVQTTVVATDDVSTVAAALATAIENQPELPVTVVHTGDVVSEGRSSFWRRRTKARMAITSICA